MVPLTEKREGPEHPYRVVDRGAMRTSENAQNANFAKTEFYEVRRFLAICRVLCHSAHTFPSYRNKIQSLRAT